MWFQCSFYYVVGIYLLLFNLKMFYYLRHMWADYFIMADCLFGENVHKIRIESKFRTLGRFLLFSPCMVSKLITM